MTRRRRPADVHGVVLFPGSGTSAAHPSMARLAEGLHPLPVRRRDFPYRLAGRAFPDRAPVLVAAVRAAVAEVCEELGTSPEHLVLGGRSMGGRMCSMAVAGADGGLPLPAAGLLLVAYPLHPPGRPDRRRVDHLPAVGVPTLFVSGDRDPFGSPEDLAAARAEVAGPVTSVTVAGGRHELAGADDEVERAARRWLSLPARRRVSG